MSQRILLVGAAGGIGRATAARLIAQHYHVIGTVYDTREAQALRTALPGIGDVAIVDLSDAVEARKAFEALLRVQGSPLAAVIGCAGMATFGPVEATRIEDLRNIMEVNVFANIAAYQAAMP
jgi:NAD(P)-dependent dehydrogenase (short-subunit alcohol dehydrogenase family)